MTCHLLLRGSKIHLNCSFLLPMAGIEPVPPPQQASALTIRQWLLGHSFDWHFESTEITFPTNKLDQCCHLLQNIWPIRNSASNCYIQRIFLELPIPKTNKKTSIKLNRTKKKRIQIYSYQHRRSYQRANQEKNRTRGKVYFFHI